jgi:hypothetical protein
MGVRTGNAQIWWIKVTTVATRSKPYSLITTQVVNLTELRPAMRLLKGYKLKVGGSLAVTRWRVMTTATT